jgi:hypothetical protein
MTYIGEWASGTLYERHDGVTANGGFYGKYGSGSGVSGATPPSGTCGGGANPYATDCGVFSDTPPFGYSSDGNVTWYYVGPTDPDEWEPTTVYAPGEFSQSEGNVYANQGSFFGGPNVSGTIPPTGTYESCCDSEFPYTSDGSLMWTWVGPATVVPEPTGFLLLFVGLISLAFAGRKNRKALKKVAVSAEEGYMDYEEKYKV